MTDETTPVEETVEETPVETPVVDAIPTRPNPAGAPDEKVVMPAIEHLKVQWDEERQIIKAQEKSAWWQFWKSRKANLFEVIRFLIMSLDELINLVEEKIPGGEDKKASVLAGIEVLYDYTIREAMPVWLRFFNPTIKHFVVHTIISTAIDWIADKYHDMTWKFRKPLTEEPVEETNEEVESPESPVEETPQTEETSQPEETND